MLDVPKRCIYFWLFSPLPEFSNKESKVTESLKDNLSQLFLALFFDLPHSFTLGIFWPFCLSSSFKTSKQLSILCLLPILVCDSPYTVQYLSFHFLHSWEDKDPCFQSSQKVQKIVFSGHFFWKEELVGSKGRSSSWFFKAWLHSHNYNFWQNRKHAIEDQLEKF